MSAHSDVYEQTYVANDERGREVDTLLGHEPESVLVNQVAVLDTANACFDGVPCALRCEAVRRDERSSLQSPDISFRVPLRTELSRRTMLRTVSQIALISATVNCELSSLSVNEATPPELQILM